MIITDIKKKGKNRYQIFVDSAFFATVLDETVVKFHLTTGLELSSENLSKIIFDGQLPLALDYSYSLLSTFNKTEKEMKEYLKKKGFSDDVISLAIIKLKNNHFLDDVKFCDNYIATHKTKSKKAIKFELRNKGIEEKIISFALENIDNQDEIVLKLAQKFVKNKKNDDKIREKLYRHLIGKGFTYGEIKKSMDKVLGEQDESWNWFI